MSKVEVVRKTTRTLVCTINKKEGCRVTTNLELYKSEAPDFSDEDCDKCKRNKKRKCKEVIIGGRAIMFQKLLCCKANETCSWYDSKIFDSLLFLCVSSVAVGSAEERRTRITRSCATSATGPTTSR